MRPDESDLDRISIHTATIFVLTDSGRILHKYTPEREAAPRLYLAGSALGFVVRTRHDVGDDTARAIESLAANEPDPGRLGNPPVYMNEYVRLLTLEAPVERSYSGMIWTFPDRLEYRHPATIVRSDTREGDQLIANVLESGMPDGLRALGFADSDEFWPPWCVALQGDEIASVAITVGIGPASAEVGVATAPGFRGRGLAAAATAGWASHPDQEGRALFYSTSSSNVSSQRVTDRLGLRLIGASLTIT